MKQQTRPCGRCCARNAPGCELQPLLVLQLWPGAPLWVGKSRLEFVQPKTNFLLQSRNVGAVFTPLSAWPPWSGRPLWASRTLQFLAKNLQESCHEVFSEICLCLRYQKISVAAFQVYLEFPLVFFPSAGKELVVFKGSWSGLKNTSSLSWSL